MTSPTDPDPETLAKIATQLDPKLACDDPVKAIQLARNLLTAANPEFAEQAEEMRLQKEAERHNDLFPRGELISIAEAFKISRGHYKTESGFAAALRKENLTTVVQEVDRGQWQRAETPAQAEKFVKYSEVTSIRAVKELFRLQHEAKKNLDRKRKSAKSKASKQNFQKTVAVSQRAKSRRKRR